LKFGVSTLAMLLRITALRVQDASSPFCIRSTDLKSLSHICVTSKNTARRAEGRENGHAILPVAQAYTCRKYNMTAAICLFFFRQKFRFRLFNVPVPGFAAAPQRAGFHAVLGAGTDAKEGQGAAPPIPPWYCAPRCHADRKSIVSAQAAGFVAVHAARHAMCIDAVVFMQCRPWRGLLGFAAFFAVH
jgi:hypothetical protein